MVRCVGVCAGVVSWCGEDYSCACGRGCQEFPKRIVEAFSSSYKPLSHKPLSHKCRSPHLE